MKRILNTVLLFILFQVDSFGQSEIKTDSKLQEFQIDTSSASELIATNYFGEIPGRKVIVTEGDRKFIFIVFETNQTDKYAIIKGSPQYYRSFYEAIIGGITLYRNE